VRGIAQAALLLRDGVSMFEPTLNIGSFETVPLETLKSIEVVTGPGGVLWGANSFLGIINLISKDADDINGLEMGMGYGDGSGLRQDFRAWVLFGKSFKFKRGPRLGIVLHVSAETYLDQSFTGPLTVALSPAPLPPGPQIWDGTSTANPERAWLVNIDGKISYGPLTLSYAFPFGLLNSSLSTSSNLASGLYDVAAKMPAGQATQNYLNTFDRFLTLQYKSRFLQDRVGVDAKLYGIQFERSLNFVIVPGSTLDPTGLSISAPVDSYRVGFSVDGDATLPHHNRLLFGGDVFHEWVPTSSVELTTNNADAVGVPPLNPAQLPINCPLAAGSTLANPMYVPGCPLPFIFAAERTVVALYISDQFRPISSLILDAGIRYQAGLGSNAYQGALLGNGLLLGSGSLVWNFYGDMHLKANYANGFRPPVFNNTNSNGAAVQFGGNRSLQNENSQAIQGEWNARLLKNIGPIRALQVRLDYAYTELDNLIVISQGSYTNSRLDSSNPNAESTRRIQSVEAGARLYVGDAVLTAGYTFLYITTNDRGLLRTIPEHQLTLGWVLPVLKWLDLNGTFILTSAYDDPDRVRSASLALPDGSLATVGTYSDVTFDRLPGQARLNLGARAHFYKNRLWSSINFYNVLNQRYYYPDIFNDVTPTVEVIPNPAPGWSFFLQVGGKPW
jgi:outer membrane receptor protein involved in Fe transport